MNRVLGDSSPCAILLAAVHLVLYADGPVVTVHVLMFGVVVTFSVEMPPFMQVVCKGWIGLDVAVSADVGCTDTFLDVSRALVSAGSGLVVVTHEVHIDGLSTVASVATPVVEHVVAQVAVVLGVRVGVATQTRYATSALGYKIVVERHIGAAPVAAVAVSALSVSCIVKRLTDDAPLDSAVSGCRNRKTFVDAPADGTVVYNKVVGSVDAEAIALVVGHLALAKSEAKVANNGVLTGDGDGIVGQAYAVAGSRLTKDGDVAAVQVEGRGEVDSATDGKGDDFLARLLHGPTEGAFLEVVLSAVVERGDNVGLAAASAGSVASVALCGGEGQRLRLLGGGHEDDGEEKRQGY